MQFRWAEAIFEQSIEQRFPGVASPRLLRERAQEMMGEAQELRAEAEFLTENDEVKAAAMRSRADELDAYAQSLLRRSKERRNEASTEVLEFRRRQVRLFLGTVMAHSLVVHKRESMQGDPDDAAVLREALSEVASPEQRSQYRQFLRQTARTFDMRLEAGEATKVARNAYRMLAQLLRSWEDDEPEADTPLTVES